MTDCTHCTDQFTLKMKANAVSRLLSALMWIESGIVASHHSLVSFFQLTALIIFWQNTLLANIWKLVFSWNKTWRNYMTELQVCMEFMYNGYVDDTLFTIVNKHLFLCHSFQKIIQEGSHHVDCLVVSFPVLFTRWVKVSVMKLIYI